MKIAICMNDYDEESAMCNIQTLYALALYIAQRVMLSVYI